MSTRDSATEGDPPANKTFDPTATIAENCRAVGMSVDHQVPVDPSYTSTSLKKGLAKTALDPVDTDSEAHATVGRDIAVQAPVASS